MSESPAPPPRRFWPPPTETAEVRKEQAKLSANVLNALAIACLVSGFVGPIITNVPETELTVPIRIALATSGVALHLAARWLLRYMY